MIKGQDDERSQADGRKHGEYDQRIDQLEIGAGGPVGFEIPVSIRAGSVRIIHI